MESTVESLWDAPRQRVPNGQVSLDDSTHSTRVELEQVQPIRDIIA